MRVLFFLCLYFGSVATATAQDFVIRKGHQFVLKSEPVYFIGTNYWFGSLLGLEKDPEKGIERLRTELDFLQSQGITNLRVMAAAEGEGLINGIERVGPAFQTRKRKFNQEVLKGLDILLHEMGKRHMKAVIFFSNNWEWSGGFQQYLQWNGMLADSLMRRKQTWDEMRDYTSRFYACKGCKKDYLKQVKHIVNRKNTVSGILYKNDPVIMAWELANEPRPMRPASIDAYQLWIREAAAFIKSLDKNHLVTTGVEGEVGTEGMAVFESIHKDPKIDYLTIHIWPRNWGWFNRDSMEKELPAVIGRTMKYITDHLTVANRLGKPLVVEEFGMPRDHYAFLPGTPTTIRDRYYTAILERWLEERKTNGAVAGLNFWAFNGIARPVPGQTFWKKGDPYMGDPPMEEQSLYGVFDNDDSTWRIITRILGSGNTN